MQTIKQATLNLKIDSTGALAGAQQYQNAASGICRMSSQVKMALAAIGAAGIATSVKLVGMASEMQEVQSKFNVVFRDLTADANKWSKNFGDAVGRSQLEIKRAMAGTQDLFVPLGFARDEAFELSKALTELSVDVASFNNSMDADVMRDFQSALVGNHETVRKYGIILSESTIEQESFAQGLNKSYRELSDQQKVLLRYNLLLKGSTDAQGDAVRTGDSYANTLKRAKAAVSDMGVELGENLLPAATKALSGMNTWFDRNSIAIRRWADDVVEGTQMVIDAMDSLEARSTSIQDQFSRFGPDTQKSILQAYESHTGDTFGMQRGKVPMSPGGFGGGTVEEWRDPKDREYARKLMESYNRQLQRDYHVTPPESEPSVSATGGGLDMQGLLAGSEGASAMSDMEAVYPSAEGFESYTDNLIESYHRQNEARREAVDEMTMMEKAVEREMDIIGRLPDSHARAAEAVEYAARAYEVYGEGSEEAQRAIEAFERSLKHLERQKDLARMADDIGAAFGRTFGDMVTGAATAEEAFRSLGSAIMDAIVQAMIVKPLVQGITMGLGGMFGVPVMHGGGIVGETASPTRHVSPSIFATAPRLHQGLAADEYPAILQKGEAVIPRGASSGAASPNVTFNVTNQTGAQVEAEQTDVRFDQGKMLVGMVLKDKRNRGPISRANRRR